MDSAAVRQPDRHFLQTWLPPARAGLAAGYEQAALPVAAAGESRIDLIAGPEGGPHAVCLHQHARLWRVLLGECRPVTHDLAPGRQVWVQVARGEAEVAGQALVQGDGAAVSGTEQLDLAANRKLLIFDLKDD